MMTIDGDTSTNNISWSAHHAQQQPIKEKEIERSALLPLFREGSKSVAMIRHSMDVVKQAVDQLPMNQTPVIAFDQPLHALVKLVQWNWKEIYSEEQFVIMMGALHIEMVALKTLSKIN